MLGVVVICCCYWCVTDGSGVVFTFGGLSARVNVDLCTRLVVGVVHTEIVNIRCFTYCVGLVCSCILVNWCVC